MLCLRQLSWLLSFVCPVHCSVSTIGIIHYNGFAGRSKEWGKLKASHVHSQFKKGLDFLLCEDYKFRGGHKLGNIGWRNKALGEIGTGR